VTNPGEDALVSDMTMPAERLPVGPPSEGATPVGSREPSHWILLADSIPPLVRIALVHHRFDTIFQDPVLATSRVAGDLGVTLQGALNLIRRLESALIVTLVQGIPDRSKRCVALDVLEALEPDLEPTFTAGP